MPGGPASGSVVKGAGPGPAVPSLAAQERAVVAALRAQPGTLHYVAEADDDINVLGLSDRLSLVGFGGDASWTGYATITGHWYSGTGEADVNTAFLTETGASGGRHLHARPPAAGTSRSGSPGRSSTPAAAGPTIIASTSTLAALDPGLAPRQYDVALKPGTNAQAYATTLRAALGQYYQVSTNGSSFSSSYAIIGLIAMLTLLLVAVAGLGVLNTVVLQTRERVHDLGVFKAVGMTPRQTIAMVVCSVAGIGLAAGLVAIPVGVALHQYVLPVMAHAAQTDVPASVLNVYHPLELVLLALCGLAIAVAGALLPATWAARARTAAALRAE